MVAVAVPASHSVDVVHEPVPTAVRRIRHRLRDVLARWELSAEVVESALLVVEELVANAVDHARTPFRLRVDHTGPVLRIAVHDGSSRAPRVRPFSAHALRGRGMVMVDGLTSRWGCEPTSSGKTVWAELPA